MTITEQHKWCVGQRVARTDLKAGLGTVLEVGRQVKVKWDNGATSYYELKLAYISLIETKE